MALNWQKQEYFSFLISRDRKANQGLEWLVEDLHSDKEKTVNRFLCHSGSEDFLWGLVRLLGSDDARVAGNSAYILGTLAETPPGCYRVISLTAHPSTDARNILPNLTRMLLFDDPECVMNAAGTMGTLAESQEGRDWILTEPCLEDTIKHVTTLLSNSNLWTASNAALVLARLTIAEEGCQRLLSHSCSNLVLSHLVQSLGVDEAGRGMNAAFAIGRLSDLDAGRTKLLMLPDSERMISLLAKMLCSSDAGASKNACFALSCLASSHDGLHRILKNAHSEEVIRTLAELLSAVDGETCWFAAMTLRTLASQPQGCLRLRDNTAVIPSLKTVLGQPIVNEDLHLEVTQTLDILKKLDKPPPPVLKVLGAFELHASWEEMSTKSGFPIKYQLYEGSRVVYTGRELQHTLTNLKAFTTYAFRIRASTEGDDSPLSDPSLATTEEHLPGSPSNLKFLAATTTQVKVGWDPPEESNGNLKMYHVFVGEKCFEQTFELVSIITGLASKTGYEISVCASTSKGKGPREVVSAFTTDAGAHAPGKPEVAVRGRNELHVQWKPPESPLGKITHYDLKLNGEVVYSGMELHTTVRRLRPDTEYTVTVSAVTNEGKYESKQVKQKTAKDSYEGDRPPLYQPPKREDTEAKKEETSPQNTPKPKKKEGRSIKSRTASANSLRKNSVEKKPSVEEILSQPSSPDVAHSPSAEGPKLKMITVHDVSKNTLTLDNDVSNAPTPTSVRSMPATIHASARGPLPKPKPPMTRKTKKTSTSVTSTTTRKHHAKVSTGNENDGKSGSRQVGMSIIRESSQVRQTSNQTKLSRSSSDVNQSYSYPKPKEIAQTEISSQVTRMYSSGSKFRLPEETQQVTGLIEFDAPLPQPSQTSGMTPTYVQRANTFIANHRPQLKKVLETSAQEQQLTSPSPPCWTPLNQLSTELTEPTSHSKFIPMQFRTQPTHMPGLKRHATVINPGVMTPSLEIFNMHRSKTGLDVPTSNNPERSSSPLPNFDLRRAKTNIRPKKPQNSQNPSLKLSNGNPKGHVELSAQSRQPHWHTMKQTTMGSYM